MWHPEHLFFVDFHTPHSAHTLPLKISMTKCLMCNLNWNLKYAGKDENWVGV